MTFKFLQKIRKKIWFDISKKNRHMHNFSVIVTAVMVFQFAINFLLVYAPTVFNKTYEELSSKSSSLAVIFLSSILLISGLLIVGSMWLPMFYWINKKEKEDKMTKEKWEVITPQKVFIVHSIEEAKEAIDRHKLSGITMKRIKND